MLGGALRRWAQDRRVRRHAFHYEHVLGTSLELQVVAAPDAARRAEAAVLAEVDRLAAVLSGYTLTSELSRWLATRGVAVPVSPELAEVLEAAAACARGVEGVAQALVNVGGDLRHHGARAIDVAVTDPRAPAENAPPVAVVRVRDEALATSGGCRRGFTIAGRAASHIVDPRTGRPAERVIGASVVAADCMTADALSTAFSVLTPDGSVALADEMPGVGCLLVETDGTVTASAEWRRRGGWTETPMRN